jgi:hypothetical protein
MTAHIEYKELRREEGLKPSVATASFKPSKLESIFKMVLYD